MTLKLKYPGQVARIIWNHESRIGEPMSAGCVLMRNLDIVELFEQVRRGDQVLIEL